jgi:predicted phosphodiesterase
LVKITGEQAMRMKKTCSLLNLFFYLIVILAVESALAQVTKGPVLLRVSEDQVSLMWETEKPGEGKVSYGKDGKNEKCQKYVVTIPEHIEYQIGQDPNTAVKKVTFIHKARLEGLKAGKVYGYCVSGPEYKSEIYSFKTTPADVNEVRFIVYGDSRYGDNTNPENHRKLIKLMIEKQVDFVVNAGDLVRKGDVYEQWQPQFFEPVKGLAESVPIYIAKGNHEGMGGTFEKLLVPQGQTNNHGFDYGPVHYFCADNITKDINDNDLLRQISADAAASKAKWKFVSYHTPSLNFGGHWSDWCQQEALANFAEAGVDFVIAGHSHLYERFYPVAPPVGTDGSFVTCITSGGGGAPLSGIETSIYHAAAGKMYHFSLFEIKGDNLTMETIDVEGQVVDRLEISKSSGQLNKEYRSKVISAGAVRFHQDLYQLLAKPLPCKPQKDKPLEATYRLPAAGHSGKFRFGFRCEEEGTYQLPEPKFIVTSEGDRFVDVQLTATPLVEVKTPVNKRGKPRPIKPLLWVDCFYETCQTKAKIAVAVKAKPAKR